MRLPNTIPADIRREATFQFWKVGAVYFWLWLLTFFPCGILVALTSKKQDQHPFGEPTEAKHREKYVKEGSSGSWEYWNSSWSWLQDWNNLEDGTLGESSGKHSASCGGTERTLWQQYSWLCRNPYNWGKRTRPLFNCPVNECDIRYWGSQEITDKAPVISGWYFVQATHRKTGRVFYGYRSVRLNDDGTVRQVNLGYKLKPGHAGTVQDPDDADKAFTIRIQFASQAD